ncbi:MAG: glycerol-3-phosphate dehydrogenase [Acidimicrobiaceae bacterium]|jgi:glycerol-3-phosphate dehydrogenase|nr:glycerol-3-phosphate dehydrogenase [Acidimicrobiaceae bacterium]
MTAARSPFDRDQALGRMAEQHFDVLIVGGGITGAGVALDAAARGLRTALVEARDFASGTSSKSSKLVHGGLRYLQQKEYRLVYEALAERQHLLDNAPYLVHPLPFLIPLFGKDGAVNKTVAKAYSTALWLYDVTGGVRIGKRHRRLTLDETRAHFPSLRTDRLVAGFLYWDARTDDARLTLAVARTAVLDHGAVVANYAPVTELLKGTDGRVGGARIGTGIGGSAGASEGVDVRAEIVVNATGVWADKVRALDEGNASGTLRPAKGIHITVPAAKLRVDMAAVVPVPKDRRSIFVVPWGDFVYLGTTDTDYSGPLENPQCTAEDVDYVLGAINAFVSEPLTRADVVGTWAGLRPLVAAASSERTADLSRRHKVTTSPSGLVTVTGGKLTTYRRMAADTVDEVVKTIGRGARRSPTKSLPLRGTAGADALSAGGAAGRLGVSQDVLAHLAGRYGGETRAIVAMVATDPDLGRPLVPGLPYLRAEAVYGARYEMAQTLGDVLERRTRALLLGRDECLTVARAVADLLAPELGWSPERVALEVKSFTDEVARERAAAGIPGMPGAAAAALADA